MEKSRVKRDSTIEKMVISYVNLRIYPYIRLTYEDVYNILDIFDINSTRYDGKYKKKSLQQL